MKKVQVSVKFYEDAILLASEVKNYMAYDGYTLDIEWMHEVALRLIGEHGARLDAKARREKYTAYKTAPAGSLEREKHRRDYLDEVAMPKKFRSELEVPESMP